MPAQVMVEPIYRLRSREPIGPERRASGPDGEGQARGQAL